MSVGLLVVRLKYGLYVGHLSKWFVFGFMFKFWSVYCLWNGRPTIGYNVLALGAVREWLPQISPQQFTPKINFFAFSFPLLFQGPYCVQAPVIASLFFGQKWIHYYLYVNTIINSFKIFVIGVIQWSYYFIPLVQDCEFHNSFQFIFSPSVTCSDIDR